MNEDKSARYHRQGRFAQLLAGGAVGGTLLLAIVSGLAAAPGDVASWVAASAGVPSSVRSWLAVAGTAVALTLVSDVVALPARFYRGFVLERRYGLSTQTSRSWVVDHAKALGIRIVLSTVGAVILIATISWWPRLWWLAATAIVTGMTIALAHLAPVLMLPLFYRFKPLEREHLTNRLLELARRARTRVLGVYEWSLGDKTTKANAALVGVRGTRRILLSDTLLQGYTDDEIEVVLAHELAHHVHRDVWTAIAADGAVTLAALLASDIVLKAFGPRVGVESLTDPAGLAVVALVSGVVSLLCGPALNLLSRRHEERADRFALDLTLNAEAFISAMRRLATHHLAEERPSAVVLWLFYTHPPFLERIATAHRWQSDAEVASASDTGGRRSAACD